MPIQGLDISLNVRNNTNYPQQINVLGNPANLLDTSNATTEYRYDLTSFTFTTENSITIQYKIVGEPSFQTYTQLLDGQNLQAVQSAINNLGIGYFNLYEELGQTYLGSYNDKYEFGDLEIFDSNAAPTTTTSTTTTTTTIAPTTSTTTTTTTLAPTTSTSTTTTTLAPTTTTSTTTTSTTLAVYTYALGVDSISGNGACLDFTIAPINYYSSSSSLGNGVVLYQDIALSTLVPDNYYADGIQNWLVTSSNGTLTTETLCSLTTSTTTTTTTLAPTTTSTTTTTTTLAPTTTSTTTTTTTLAFETFSLTYSNTAGSTACSDYSNPTNRNFYYATSGSTLTSGTILYTTSALNVPVANGYYSNGVNYWETAANAGNLQVQTSCNPTTTTSTTTTTTTLLAGSYLCVTNGGVFPYPVTAGNGSASGTLWNDTGSTIYVYGVFNSGGNSSGSIAADSGIVNGSGLTFSGTITSSGQTFYSTNYVALNDGDFVTWSLSKQDTLSSGATLQLGYALTIGGAVSNIPESCAVPPSTTTSTTTTTTTLVGNIDITNGSLDVEISNVNFNGVDAVYVAGVYPNTTGNGTSLYTDQVGTYTMLVFRSNAVAGQHITVTDSNGTPQCIFFSNGSQNETYTGVVYDGVTNIQIDVQDGAC